MKTLVAKEAELRPVVRQRRVERTAAEAREPGEQLIAKRYIELLDEKKPPYSDHEVQNALAPLLGQSIPDDASATADHTYALTGYAHNTGLIIAIDFLSFDEPALGAAALCEWLKSRGCISLYYEVEGEPAYDDEELDDAPPDE